MRLLLDTHILLWLADKPERLPISVLDLLKEPTTELVFSVVNIWEVGIKFSLGKPAFQVDPSMLLLRCRSEKLTELPVLAEHSLQVPRLPLIHRDPFDRILIAQAIVEGLTFLTADTQLGAYADPVRLI